MTLSREQITARYRAKKRGEIIIPIKREIETYHRGAGHPSWVGDNACEKTGRTRANRLYPGERKCEMCESPHAERHHKDGNTLNNCDDNINSLCRKCHMREDGRIEKLRQMAINNLQKTQEAAAQAKRNKKFCPKGHPYSGDNLYVNPKGSRCCRKCLNDYKREKRYASNSGELP